MGWNNLDGAEPESFNISALSFSSGYKLYIENNNWIIRHEASGEKICEGSLNSVTRIECKVIGSFARSDAGFVHVYLDGHTKELPKKIRLFGTNPNGKKFVDFKLAMAPRSLNSDFISQSKMKYKACSLGGIGIDLKPKKYGFLEVSSSGFNFASYWGDWNRSFDELVTIEIDGKGYYTTGGGFVGYGNTADAQARGNKQALILNSLTSRVESDCRLRIVYPGQEVTFKVEHEPTQLGIDLSGIKNWLTVRGKAENKSPASDVDQLEKLIAMFEKGHLSQSEFEAAKRKLLDS